MGLVSKTYTFTAGTVIVASEHNSNFDTLYDCVNGNIDNANIKAAAAIAYNKLNLAGQILNADVNANALIALTKLNLSTALTNAHVSTAAAIDGLKINPAFVSSMSVAGSIYLTTAGNMFLIKTGANASIGTALLAGGTAVVSNTLVTTASLVFLSNQALGGTAGALYISNVTAGAGFYIRSSIATDSSRVAYQIIERL